MEQEFDLRPYLEALLRSWYWIIGGALIAALVAYGISSLLSPTYTATALVAITEPQERIQFDPRFEAISEERPLQAFPELATSDELLQTLLQELEPPLTEVRSVEAARQILTAESGRDPSLLRLKVNYGDAAESARIANAWATLFVGWVNNIFGDQNDEQLTFFETQLEQAAVELAVSEQVLVEFQTRNTSDILRNELNVLKETQQLYLNDEQSLSFLMQDLQDLRNQLAMQTTGDDVSFADQLTALLLQIEAYGVETTIPLQIDAGSSGALTTSNRQEQIAALDGLIGTLEDRLALISERLAELEPRILDLQKRVQEIQTEHQRLARNIEVSTETYTALARKVEEERISSQDTSSGVQIASKAAVPVRPVSPRKLLNTAVAVILGLAIGALGVFVTAWWR